MHTSLYILDKDKFILITVEEKPKFYGYTCTFTCTGVDPEIGKEGWTMHAVSGP